MKNTSIEFIKHDVYKIIDITRKKTPKLITIIDRRNPYYIRAFLPNGEGFKFFVELSDAEVVRRVKVVNFLSTNPEKIKRYVNKQI